MLRRIVWIWLGLFAGAGVYLWVINRILSHLRIPRIKHLLGGTLVLGFGGGFGWLGYVNHWGRLGVAATLAALGLGELNYRRSTRNLRGAAPVERIGPPAALLRPFTTTDLQVERYEVRLDPQRFSLPAGARLRVAHISDLHLNDHLPREYYYRVVEAAAAADPNLVFITGDFVSDAAGVYQFAELERILRSRNPHLELFGIFGNHDYWAGADEVAAELRRAGVTLLGNGWQRRQVGPFRLLLAGCEEPWSPDRLALPELEPGELLLVLSHSADNIYRLSQAGAAGVFSGHYHAGQFQLPGFGPVFIPSHYGRRFHRGHYIVGETHLFVSAGVGAHEPPWRLYCPPDIFIVDYVAG